MRLVEIRRVVLGAVLVATGFLFGAAVPAAANHRNESCGPVYVQEAGFAEAANMPSSAPFDRDAVHGMLKVVNPSPAVQDEIVHSVYLYKSADDVLELGWDWSNGSPAVVFSTKTYNGHYTYVANLSNPGGGFLNAGSTPTFRIWRNVSGSNPDRFDMYRSGLFYGFYNQDRMTSGAAVAGGTEGFSACEDMGTTSNSLQLKTCPSCTWQDWTAVRTITNPAAAADTNTKWWYVDKQQSPPAWFLKHCGSAWCADV